MNRSSKQIWLLGFGFFSISLTWALYNAFVPYFLEPYVQSTALIGFFMTIDNYFALFLQPWIGRRSDRTATRFGRRLPYLMLGMPLAALFTAMIPLHWSLGSLLVFMLLMNLSMSIYRSPTIALMPDITPESKRTRANGIINVMGGVGSVLAFAGGSYLYGANRGFPFWASAVLTIVALFIVFRTIKGKQTDAYTQGNSSESALPPARTLLSELDRTTWFLLAAVFFWFVAYQGVEALFTLYGTNHLGMTEGQASFSLTFFSLSFLLFALPSGLLGSRFGKKTMLIIGVLGLLMIFGILIFVESALLVRVLLIIGGVFWACININSYPLVVATGKEGSIGTRTGLYYLVSSLAAIVSPPLIGQMVDYAGYGMLFWCAAGGMAAALVCMLGVKEKEKASIRRLQSLDT